MTPSKTNPVLSKLHLSEVVTLGCLFALKGRSFLAFYRWLKRDFLTLFPQLPERSRLQRLLEKYAFWCVDFLAQPSFFTVIDSYPIETIRPCREGRSPNQLGRKSKDKGRCLGQNSTLWGLPAGAWDSSCAGGSTIRERW